MTAAARPRTPTRQVPQGGRQQCPCAPGPPSHPRRPPKPQLAGAAAATIAATIPRPGSAVATPGRGLSAGPSPSPQAEPTRAHSHNVRIRGRWGAAAAPSSRSATPRGNAKTSRQALAASPQVSPRERLCGGKAECPEGPRRPGSPLSRPTHRRNMRSMSLICRRLNSLNSV